jgi:hypothetical protein
VSPQISLRPSTIQSNKLLATNYINHTNMEHILGCLLADDPREPEDGKGALSQDKAGIFLWIGVALGQTSHRINKHARFPIPFLTLIAPVPLAQLFLALRVIKPSFVLFPFESIASIAELEH